MRDRWVGVLAMIAVVAAVLAFNVAVILGIVWLAAKIVKAVFS